MNRKSYFTHDRTDIFRLIPSGVHTVLDVGCGAGVLGRRLKDLGMEVIGLERNEESWREAKKYLDKVICCDAEKVELPFEEKYFDCIIYGDILEHFYNPWVVLERYKRYLKDDGFVIASIPNVRYYKILIRLFAGTWDYVDSGMLDRSHVRFFTLVNIKEMFVDAGFEMVSIARNIVSARGFRVLNFILFNSLKDFLTYQYYIVAKKSVSNKSAIKTREIYRF
jgi:ubiquinone/menaquinone biosynthesis C-methylase UbiE